MTTEPRVWLPKAMFALQRLEMVIERFERREAARNARGLALIGPGAGSVATNNLTRKD